MTLSPEQAAELLKAWEEKLAGRSPTLGERRIMDHYRDIMEGVYIYDPTTQPCEEGDL